MRKWTFMMLSVLVLLGCTTAPPVGESESQGESDEAVAVKEEPKAEAEKEQPKEKVEKIVTETIYLLVREESSSTDGFIDRYTEISYEDEGMRVLEEKEFGIDGALEKVVTYEYEGDSLRRVNTFDGSNGLISYHEYEYNDSGMLVSDSLLNPKKELQVQSLYEYDSGNRKVKWIVRSSEETTQAYTEYIYGRYSDPDRIEMYTSSGALESYVENEFDSLGHRVREVYREVDGSVWKFVEYGYKDDFLVEERHYQGNNALTRVVSYEYDNDGNVSAVVYAGPGGSIQDKRTKFYTARSIQRVVIE